MNQTPSLKVSFYQFLLVTMTTVIREGNITQVTLRGYIQNEHYKLLLSLRSDIQDGYCKSMLSLQKSYLKCVLRICAVIARILFKMRIAILCCHCKNLSKMHIPKLCCHCKNFIQNGYCKIVLSLQEFYAKRVLQIYAVTAQTIHCNHSLGFLFKIMQQALNNERSAVPQ